MRHCNGRGEGGPALTSMFSHTMSVSTAPMSRHISVSATPKQYLPVSCEISSKYLLTSFFSWMNLTLDRHSADSSIACSQRYHTPLRREAHSGTVRTAAVDELRAAGEDSLTWLKPFSPPYETSTVLRTMAANLPSNRSDMPRTFLKSADPARMIPDTLGESFVMNICVASSAT